MVLWWPGAFNGYPMRGRGTLLDPRVAAYSLEQARLSNRQTVQLVAVKDWVVDYTAGALTLWVCTDTAWYQ